MTVELSQLGKATTYKSEYDPGLLFPIPRVVKRDEIGVPNPLPFVGVDIWNAYELSWLNEKGKPCVGIAEFYIPADSVNLIESKSFKLYLNSFNQTQLADIEELKNRLVHDLSKACGKPVEVSILLPAQFAKLGLNELKGQCIDELDITVTDYQPKPELLTTTGDKIIEETLVSHLLKSNCLVTGQPDWGSVQIYYRGKAIDREGLLKYLISFRQHNEFHEQCVERIFMDISRQCQPEKLMVYARYTRRGGLDINPLRANFKVTARNERNARQ